MLLDLGSEGDEILSSNFVEVGIQLPKAGAAVPPVSVSIAALNISRCLLWFLEILGRLIFLKGSWPDQHHGVLCEELRHTASWLR